MTNETDSSNVVLGINVSFVERKLEDEEWSEEEHQEMSLKTINNFINQLKSKLEDNIADRILICNAGLCFIDDLEVGVNKIEDFELVTVYVLLTNTVPAEELDGILLEMDDYGFYANYPNQEGQIVIQGYDEGEYDTGYFASTIGRWDADPEYYIASENIDHGKNVPHLYRMLFSYNIAKDILLNNLKVNDQVEVNDNKYLKSYSEKALIVAKNIGDEKWAERLERRMKE